MTKIKKIFLVLSAMSDNLTVIVALWVFFCGSHFACNVVFGSQSRNEKSKREHELALERIELEKERLSKAIIMIPCQYCGGLVPQETALCPNCGAKRVA